MPYARGPSPDEATSPVANTAPGGRELAEVLDLIEAIYDTVVEPARWPGVLERISNHVGVGCALINLVDTRSDKFRIAASWGASEAFLAALRKAMPSNPVRFVHWYRDVDDPYTTEMIMGREAFLNSRFYREVNQPFDCIGGVVSILTKTADRAGNIALPRWTEHGEITSDDIEKVRRLSPHIRRAVTLTDLLDTQSLKASLLSQTFDSLRTAIILLDAEGRIEHANSAAEDLLRRDGGLKALDGALVIDDAAAAAAFRKALQPAAGETNGAPQHIPVKAGREGELSLWLLSLDTALGRQMIGHKGCAFAVFVGDSPNSGAPPAEIFVRRYGLTPAEARVLAHLVDGVSPNEAAAVFGISIHTVRSHMQKVFAKTDCKNLPQLLHLAHRQISPIAR